MANISTKDSYDELSEQLSRINQLAGKLKIAKRERGILETCPDHEIDRSQAVLPLHSADQIIFEIEIPREKWLEIADQYIDKTCNDLIAWLEVATETVDLIITEARQR